MAGTPNTSFLDPSGLRQTIPDYVVEDMAFSTPNFKLEVCWSQPLDDALKKMARSVEGDRGESCGMVIAIKTPSVKASRQPGDELKRWYHNDIEPMEGNIPALGREDLLTFLQSGSIPKPQHDRSSKRQRSNMEEPPKGWLKPFLPPRELFGHPAWPGLSSIDLFLFPPHGSSQTFISVTVRR